MEYLEAIAIKRLRPDSLPQNLAHLLEEADRVIKLHKAMCFAHESLDLLLPALSAEHRQRVNAVLIANLALACGRLQCWGGPGKPKPLKPIEFTHADSEQPLPPLPARPSVGPGNSATMQELRSNLTRSS